MSWDKCRTCRRVGFCTFGRDRVITECDDYEGMDTAAAYDWDLTEMLKLWAKEESLGRE